MVAATGSEAVTNGRRYSTYEPGMCLQWVRDPCWGIGSLYASAIEAWDGARHKHPGDRTPPIGAPCFYRGGQYGHVVIFTPADTIRSTDCRTTGKVDEVAISWVEDAWGYDFCGWAEDLNSVRLPLGNEEDDMQLNDEIAEWSPDDGNTGETTIGKTLNQARGYSEDTFQRLKKLETDVDRLENKIDKILDKLG